GLAIGEGPLDGPAVDRRGAGVLDGDVGLEATTRGRVGPLVGNRVGDLTACGRGRSRWRRSCARWRRRRARRRWWRRRATVERKFDGRQKAHLVRVDRQPVILQDAT